MSIASAQKKSSKWELSIVVCGSDIEELETNDTCISQNYVVLRTSGHEYDRIQPPTRLFIRAQDTKEMLQAIPQPRIWESTWPNFETRIDQILSRIS